MIRMSKAGMRLGAGALVDDAAQDRYLRDAQAAGAFEVTAERVEQQLHVLPARFPRWPLRRQKLWLAMQQTGAPAAVKT